MKARRLRKYLGRNWDWMLLLVVFLLSVVFVFTPRIQTNDDIGYYAYVRSVIINGNIDLGEEYTHYRNISMNLRPDMNTGVYYSQYPIGISVLEFPWTTIGHMIALVRSYEADGYSEPYIFLTCLGSAVYGFIALLLLLRLLKRFFSRTVSFISVLGIWLASPLYFYMFLQPSVSHSFSFFAVTLFLFVWLHRLVRNRRVNLSKERSNIEYFLLGILAGLMTLVRYMDVIFVSVLFIEFLYKIWPSLRRGRFKKIWPVFSRYLIALLGFVIILIPQLLLLLYQHGTANALGYYDGSFDISKSMINLPLVLFSAHHGLFYWHPLLLVMFAGLVVGLWGKNKEFSVVALIVFILLTHLVSSWGTNAFAAQSFGHRFFVSYCLFFAFGFGMLMNFFKDKRWLILFAIITILAIAWNFGLIAQYGSRMIATEGPVSFKEMAYNNFYRLPSEIADIAKRFMFNRKSFS